MLIKMDDLAVSFGYRLSPRGKALLAVLEG
jgi:hypothetical protein